MAFADHITLADRAALAHLGGVDMIYGPAAGAPVTVKGIFDELVMDPATGRLGPSVFVRLADLPVHPDNDTPTITISGRQYTVRGRIADGLGGVHISLVAVT